MIFKGSDQGEMKMKKLISVILAGVMMAGVCACGIVDLGKKGRETTEEEVEPVTATTTAETTTETTAAAKEPTEATEDVVESTVASDKVRADEVPIKALKPLSYDNASNVTYLKATPEDTKDLTEGPKEYHYGVGTIYMKYSGSDTFESGVLIISDVRCVVSRVPSPMDDLYFWTIDDDWALDRAIDEFCKDKGIQRKELGLIMRNNIQSITDEYYSSLRYQSTNTWNLHYHDGDEYEI